MKTEIELD